MNSTINVNWKKEAILYSVLVLGLTLAANLSGVFELVGVSQASPLIAVLLLLLFRPRRKETLLSTGMTKLGGLRWYIIALLSAVPVMAGFAAAWGLGCIALPDAHEFSNGMTMSAYFQVIARSFFSPNMLIMMTLFSFAEEIGWRGYLQPTLTRDMGAKKAIMITAAVWAVFHYPFYLNGYNEDGLPLVTIALFTAMIFPLSVVMGWIRHKSGSLWPAVIMHTAINHSRSWFEALFYHKQVGWTYVAGESGIVTLLLWSVAAVLVWRSLSDSGTAAPNSGKTASL
ncbi:CPBP family intramembrane glutamic endopeptidase [Paenibacillus apiarius]|uniref:CPBP family intramembrane metalloprotease n=1 Tax=Paenibacillus apiarius TaxID=46240 RepID=A0ABT4DQ58_9BACL|nr:CPBP family intramembrane glutamic endopeptidase [Paenibacillus apiarius]MCY9515541.1 CPBP family intramembrane metalloprotease [Paenibacillus apiarius]MCY9519386.1 CPBP family intramembrane metalloprotease [Paenibacillus apiarius]MCY9551022.1 CPBP family intramembrane metalloprotease [Paenibacillus apiarius]MCY9558886.1 CPBP family intramembrane metalloprotease [Paenibacillus apiarius]MCY9685572.1 CPBP family intramembrane metalloprotease [Paenibacillus apiarius]